ncbi:MAG TPA: hypothetical protein VHC69_23745 [Polyangiaceae bacterium]|nr:hypothetical protein [Polyangiaceae bacterium]
MTFATAIGDFGAPPDAMAWGAVVLAGVALGFSRSRRFLKWQRTLSIPALLAALASFAFLLSAAYVSVYLRGGPRIIDATTYYLQARALSEGHVAFAVPSPTASFRGRFLLGSADGHALAGIFPPGYPALLALGFVLHAPMLVGPLLAAALVVATYALALRLVGSRDTALFAAALSSVCAVLRYHTADTMSHGLSALLFALTIWAALGSSNPSALVAGFCAGWLVATRPVTGFVALSLAAFGVRRAPRSIALLGAGALVPLALFLVEQRAATGAWLTSSQAAYYALADGPPGCFRYGFGSGIGCVFEHGDFVRAHLSHGYGALAAAGTTLRRLKMHLADAANIELGAPLLVYAAVQSWRGGRRIPVLAVLGVVVAYVPFYFDGNYPGGGARFFADVLPFEHVLLASACVRLGVVAAAFAVALAGFAFHTVYDHVRLSEREGGRPLFDRSVLDGAGVDGGLVFVDTDHGFDLGYDPDVTGRGRGVLVARRRRDAHDVVLWQRLGRPRAFEYESSLAPHAPPPKLVPLTFEDGRDARFEAEAEWPPLLVEGGYTAPSFPPCASSHRALALRPSARHTLRVRVELPVAEPGKYRIRSGWVTSGAGDGVTLVTSTGLRWAIALEGPQGTCSEHDGPAVELQQASDYIDVLATSALELDYLELVRDSAHRTPE